MAHTTQRILDTLRSRGYKDTQTRRLVAGALAHFSGPVSPYDLRDWIAARGDAISTVTVYRILEILESLGVVHRHPCSGKFIRCEHPDRRGPHAYLHCHTCGKSQEFTSTAIGRVAALEAKKRKFTAASPLFEIVGTCFACRRT